MFGFIARNIYPGHARQVSDVKEGIGGIASCALGGTRVIVHEAYMRHQDLDRPHRIAEYFE